MVETRAFVPTAMPPLVLPPAPGGRRLQSDPIPRLRRLLCVAAALTLPVLGVAVADTVHRTIASKASQAAAPVNPSDGAAVPSGAPLPKRALRAVRTARLSTTLEEARS
jgi:hypothetical protein